jgi:hypothetical protein
MESILIQNKEDRRPEYPCLKVGRNSGSIVLFSAPKKGTVVFAKEKSIHDLGNYSDGWDMNLFEPFDGQVKLVG